MPLKFKTIYKDKDLVILIPPDYSDIEKEIIKILKKAKRPVYYKELLKRLYPYIGATGLNTLLRDMLKRRLIKEAEVGYGYVLGDNV